MSVEVEKEKVESVKFAVREYKGDNCHEYETSGEFNVAFEQARIIKLAENPRTTRVTIVRWEKRVREVETEIEIVKILNQEKETPREYTKRDYEDTHE